MNWIIVFELLCYAVVAVLLTDWLRRKDFKSLFTFGSAVFVRFAMALLSVSFIDTFHYSDKYLFTIGFLAKQVPVCEGLIWGALTVCSIKIAEKFRFKRFLTCLTVGMIAVTLDIFFSIAAVRINGGFCTLENIPVETAITNRAFMGVTWTHFLMRIIEICAVACLNLYMSKRTRQNNLKKQCLSTVIITLIGIAVTAVSGLIVYGLNSVTNSWFACITFAIIWLFMIEIIIMGMIRERMYIAEFSKWDIPVLIFWASTYISCLIAMIALKLFSVYLWLLIVCIIFALVTVFLSVAEKD